MTIQILFSDKTVRVAVEVNGVIESAIAELPQRPWVELTAEEKQECINKSVYHTAWASDVDIGVLIDLVNDVLKEKNG